MGKFMLIRLRVFIDLDLDYVYRWVFVLANLAL
jgi:hypothetical protein